MAVGGAAGGGTGGAGPPRLADGTACAVRVAGVLAAVRCGALLREEPRLWKKRVMGFELVLVLGACWVLAGTPLFTCGRAVAAGLPAVGWLGYCCPPEMTGG